MKTFPNNFNIYLSNLKKKKQQSKVSKIYCEIQLLKQFKKAKNFKRTKLTVSIIGDDFEAAIRAKSNCKKTKKNVEEMNTQYLNYVNKSNIYDIVAMLVIILDLLNF